MTQQQLRDMDPEQRVVLGRELSGGQVYDGSHTYYTTYDPTDADVGGCGHTHNTLARAQQCISSTLIERDEFRIAVGFTSRSLLTRYPRGRKMVAALEAATDTAAPTGTAPAWLDNLVRLGKYRGSTWREVTQTSAGRSYLRWATKTAMARSHVKYRSLGEFAQAVLAWWMKQNGQPSSAPATASIEPSADASATTAMANVNAMLAATDVGNTAAVIDAAESAIDTSLAEASPQEAADMGAEVALAAKPYIEEIAREAGADAGSTAGAKTGAVAAGELVDEYMEKTMPNMVKVMVEQLAPRKIVVTTPTNVEGVEFDSQHPLFEDLLLLVGQAQERRIWIAGPAGSGKTTAAEKVALALGMDFYIQTPVCDKFELFGYCDVNGNYISTPIYDWATNPDGGVLLLDEIDAFMPQALVAANTFLADRGWATFPDKTKVRLTEKHIVIVTANTWGSGPDSQYVGRAPIDAATKNRFPTKIDWGYDEAFESRLAASMGGHLEHVKICQAIRKNLGAASIRCIFSPRDTFSYCAKRNAGFTHEKALTYSVLAELPKDQRSKALSGISNATPGVKQPTKKSETAELAEHYATITAEVK